MLYSELHYLNAFLFAVMKMVYLDLQLIYPTYRTKQKYMLIATEV